LVGVSYQLAKWCGIVNSTGSTTHIVFLLVRHLQNVRQCRLCLV